MRISPKKTFKSFLGLINLIFIIPLNPSYSEGSNLKLNEPVTVAVRKFKNFAGDFAENGVIEGKSASLFFRAKKTYSLPAHTKKELPTVFFGLNYLPFGRLYNNI